MNLAENFKIVNDKIATACAKCDRDPESLVMIAVTKTVDIETIKQVIDMGYIELGESRAQRIKQLVPEIEQSIYPNPNWHFIGHLQRNKAKKILGKTALIHSLDSLRLAEEISEGASKLGIDVKVLMQINCSGEEQKYGIPVGAAIHLAEQIVTMPGLKLCGIMTMAANSKNRQTVRGSFQLAKEIFEDIKAKRFPGPEFQHISMGMTNDYETAIEEGATILRIGSALFAD